MGLTLLKNRLRRYLEAEAAILRGEEYQLENRRLRRPNLSEVRKAITDLSAQIALIESGGTGRTKRVVFIDE